MKKNILILLILILSAMCFPYEESVFGEYFFYCQEYSISLWFNDGDIFHMEPGLSGKAGEFEIIKSKMGYLLRIKLNGTDEFFFSLHWGQKIKGVGTVEKQNAIRFNDGPEIKTEIRVEKIAMSCTLEKL